MQDDPLQDEPDESHGENSDVDENDATEISEAETEKPNTGEVDSNGLEDPSQSLVLGDSLAGVLPSDASGIIEDEIKSTDVGSSESEIHYGTKRFLQAFFPFAEWGFSGGVEAWDVDLGDFLNDVEDDPRAASMLGTPKKFDLDAEGSSQDTDETSGIIDVGLFGDELSIKQISEATKWLFFEKSRPEDYDTDHIAASYNRRRSRKFAELLSVAMGVAICMILAFLIVWLPFAIF